MSAARGSVLLIDDEGRLSSRGEAALTPAGYAVVTVGHAAAISVAQRRPDIIVITPSVEQPDVAGLIEELRSDPLVADIPILQWSPGPVGPDEAVASLESGATSVIAEPTTDRLVVATVESMLEFRDRQRELEVALSVSGSGTFEWAIPTGEVRWSQSLERVHGLEPGHFGGTFEDFLSYVHPDELQRVGAIISDTLESGERYSIVYQGRRDDGGPLWIEGHGRVFRDLDGVATKLVGVALDVTTREQTVVRIEQLRTLAADLNADDTTDEIMATVNKALADHAYKAELHDAGPVIAQPAPGAIRRRTAQFVFDLVPPSSSISEATAPRSTVDQVSTIADLAVSALRRGWRFDIERETASTLQRALLPARLPAVDGWAIDALYEPTSDEDRLGGDFYDVILRGDHLVAMIGDVSGHGLAATAQMSAMRNLLRTLAIQHGGDPAAMLVGAAQLVEEVLPGDAVFVTAAVVTIGVADGHLRYASAGHPPPIVRTDGGADLLVDREALGAPLGMRVEARAPLRSHERQVGAGDTVILYTDGMVERRGEALDTSLRRFASQIAGADAAPSPGILLALSDDDALNPDDRAVLCLHRRG